ncbi:hypothetical protein FRB90_001854 [Tulasnella sp. 427]|nr:hypothetical protein FRB90_001854 [Tulasnella sp. 427]
MALKEIAMHGGSALKLRKQENNPQATQAQNALLELDHPNIVQYLGFEVTDRLLRVFLEYVPGGSISSLLRRQGKFDEDVIKFFTAQIVDGLAYLHGRNITHKDLKADEILVDPSGQCKISDYGLSKLGEEYLELGL